MVSICRFQITTDWERYSKLTLDFENAQVGNQADKTVLVSPKNFKNAKTFRIGTQYMLTG